MEREPLLYVVVGRKKIGKTFTTMKKLRQYVAGNPAAGIPGRRVLIFDSNNEYSDKLKYPDILSMALQDTYLFSRSPAVEIRRIPPFLPNGKEMTPDQKATAVLYILEHFRNGLLLLEDINGYIGDHLPSDVVGVILAQRHKGIDMMLHYHSLGRIQKKIWPHINAMRMHKTGDTVDRNKDKFPDKYEMFNIAEKIINRQYALVNQRFWLEIDCDNDKIYADVADDDREAAIREYLQSAIASLINPKLAMRNEAGGKLYDFHSAFQEERQRIIDTYFDSQ